MYLGRLLSRLCLGGGDRLLRNLFRVLICRSVNQSTSKFQEVYTSIRSRDQDLSCRCHSSRYIFALQTPKIEIKRNQIYGYCCVYVYSSDFISAVEVEN